MLTYELRNHRGFAVIHKSTSWRIALHAYEAEVNGLEAFQNWGFHRDSQEAFVLLKGAAWLVLSQEGKDKEAETGGDTGEEDWQLYVLEEGRVYVVQAGEGHAIVLREGSEVLIMENQDMSQTCQRAIPKEVQEAVKKEIGGC